MNPKSSRYLLPAVLAVAIGSPTGAHAKKADVDIQSAINQLTVTIQELEQKDEGRVATPELGLARAWTSEAQSYVDNRKKRLQLEQTLQRLKVVTDLVDVMIRRAAAEAAANTAVAVAKAKEADTAKIKAETTKLQSRQRTLEKGLNE